MDTWLSRAIEQEAPTSKSMIHDNRKYAKRTFYYISGGSMSHDYVKTAWHGATPFFCYGEEGRLDGAVKKGKTWLIPSDTKKPEDGRYKRMKAYYDKYIELEKK